MIIQPIVDIAEICARRGITQAVICPGSRSAALTLAFSRHPGISTYVIPDERSAAYVAMGMAQSSENPVVVICTSGTAAANLYPAIIEAFYQQIPLLVLTADRPPEWIDQQDGQSIRQHNLYENHILASYQFPVAFERAEAIWHANRMVNEAILKSEAGNRGPVHINVPIREPFYPSADEAWQYSGDARIIAQLTGAKGATQIEVREFESALKRHQKIMLVIGQGRLSEVLIESLATIQANYSWVIIGDILSNIHLLKNPITKHDLILMDQEGQQDLVPDLLITIGQSVLSKGLKGFLRKLKPQEHWHVGEEQDVADTFRCLTKKVLISPEFLFRELSEMQLDRAKAQQTFLEKWNSAQKKGAHIFTEFLADQKDGEFKAAHLVMGQLPDNCGLHLANSMAVRYANYLGIKGKENVSVWSNRGASGIDGCTSTAVGHAINEHAPQVLITGDMAFFYDRNALWHEHVPDNLKIIILNNHGGGIFRLIDGPKVLPELENYFETRQNLSAANTAKDFGFAYFPATSNEELSGLLDEFYAPSTGKSILEIFSDPEMNQKVFEDFKQRFQHQL